MVENKDIRTLVHVKTALVVLLHCHDVPVYPVKYYPALQGLDMHLPLKSVEGHVYEDKGITGERVVWNTPVQQVVLQ